MAYQTLYRKYRPKTFELVFGQDTIVKTLKNVIKNNKLSHAYLFTGPRGTGKTSSAKLFAKAINCLNNSNGDACNECENCKSFNTNNNPDIIEIDAASNNGVDEIREIRNKVNLVPSISKYKVYIIDEVHMLSIGAFNALLKTLEEPPEYIIFILATTEPQKLPTTVISRCQRFDFKSISKEQMKKCLENIVKKENIKIEEDALYEIIENSNGGMRDAIGMLDQSFAFCDDIIKLNDIQELSGCVSNEEINFLFKKIIDNDYESTLEQIKKWSILGKDFNLITQKIINFIRIGILYKKNIKNNSINDETKKVYDLINENKLYMMIEKFTDILNKIQVSNFKEMIFEVEIISLIDSISLPRELSKKQESNNVSRETYENPKEDKISNEILKKELEINVPRETLEKKQNLKEKIKELKEIRINNTIKKSSKNELKFINDLWNNINEYLIEEKYKEIVGVLIECKAVAASDEGIIVTVPTDSILKKIEQKYDLSKQLFSEIYNKNYRIVYITEDYWKQIRPDYVEKVKNNELELKDEEYLLSQINKIQSENNISEFDELIEMEG